LIVFLNLPLNCVAAAFRRAQLILPLEQRSSDRQPSLLIMFLNLPLNYVAAAFRQAQLTLPLNLFHRFRKRKGPNSCHL
jgi:hypothetical protein